MAGSTPPSPRVAQLAALPMLSVLDRGQLEKIVEAGDERIFHPGETILRQGDRALGLYLMLSGTADVRRSGQKVASLSAGHFFGESALFVDEPRSADVFAITEVRCFVVNRWEFWSAVGVDPQVNRALYQETVARLRSLQSASVE